MRGRRRIEHGQDVDVLGEARVEEVVASDAARKDTITSARGQSQPVLMASFAISTRTQFDSCTRSGEM